MPFGVGETGPAWRPRAAPVRHLMKTCLALVLALLCATVHADPVFVLSPDEMHYPIRPDDIAYVHRDGEAFAKAAGLAPLRASDDVELRIWTRSVWSAYQGQGTAYVLAKGRLTTYALTRPGDGLRAVRTATRRVARGKAPVAELRAAWKVAGRPGCDVADASIALVEASLDGRLVAFSGLDAGGLPCQRDVDVRMTTLLRAVRALAGR